MCVCVCAHDMPKIDGETKRKLFVIFCSHFFFFALLFNCLFRLFFRMLFLCFRLWFLLRNAYRKSFQLISFRRTIQPFHEIIERRMAKGKQREKSSNDIFRSHLIPFFFSFFVLIASQCIPWIRVAAVQHIAHTHTEIGKIQLKEHINITALV